MRTLVILALALTCAPALATDAWFRPLPSSMFTTPPVAVARERHVEIPVSMLARAEVELRDVPALQLASYGPENYGRPEFSCPPGSTPYLVRALFLNGATGGYHLERRGASLVVIHASLGLSPGPSRSALLACLDFTPAEVYVGTSGGM